MTVRLVEVAEEPTGTSARPLHRHPDVAELIWVLEGRGALLGPDGRELDVVPGEAVVVPAGRPHRMAAEGGRLRLLCVFPTGALETRDLEP